jgi:pilus assembly protein Flp/PilA
MSNTAHMSNIALMSNVAHMASPNGSSGKSHLRRTVALMREFLVADERGATAIEYALIASAVGATIAATVFGFGSNLKTVFYDKIAAML